MQLKNLFCQVNLLLQNLKKMSTKQQMISSRASAGEPTVREMDAIEIYITDAKDHLSMTVNQLLQIPNVNNFLMAKINLYF